APSVGSVVAFPPPSIKDAEVDDTVERGFLTACPARLQREARGIEPNVDPLDEEFRHVHVIIFYECHVASYFMIVAEAQDFMNEITTRFICWVGFASEDQLDGAPLVMEQVFEPIEVAEQQGRPLVGGKTPGKADRERFWVEQGASR